MSKIPYGLKVVKQFIEGDKLVMIVKLKWWYAIYTAIISCFSAQWYTEQKIEIPKENEKEKK